MTVHQETEGLLSPWVRNLRLRKVAARVQPSSRVLDLACGNGFLRSFLPEGCTYYGVDRLQVDDTAVFDGFIQADLLAPEVPDRLLTLMGGAADFITCAAFLEHVSEPESIVRTYRALLADGGAMIGTTPHPRGRLIHSSLARAYLCSRSGSDEHEDFLSRESLERIARAAGGQLAEYRTFLSGLNQLFVFSFDPGGEAGPA